MIVYGPDCETTGLSPVDHELIAVQFADAEGSIARFARWEHDGEAAMLAAFLEAWTAIDRKRAGGGAMFVGVNHLGFDVPFLLARGIALADDLEHWSEGRLWDELYRWPVYLDLAQLVGNDLVGMADLRRELLETAAERPSRDVPVLYRNERFDALDERLDDQLAALRAVHLALRGTDLYREVVRFRRRLDAARDLT
ncbi:MAG: hypothetical protein ACLFM8_04650 [Halobacteriales archaeon]